MFNILKENISKADVIKEMVQACKCLGESQRAVAEFLDVSQSFARVCCAGCAVAGRWCRRAGVQGVTRYRNLRSMLEDQ